MYYFWLLLGTIPYAITKPTRSDTELTALNRQDEPENGQELINTPSYYDGIERAASSESGVEYAYRDIFVKSKMESCPKYYDYYATLANFQKENDKFGVRCSSTWTDLGDQPDGLRDGWGTVIGTPCTVFYNLTEFLYFWQLIDGA